MYANEFIGCETIGENRVLRKADGRRTPMRRENKHWRSENTLMTWHLTSFWLNAMCLNLTDFWLWFRVLSGFLCQVFFQVKFSHLRDCNSQCFHLLNFSFDGEKGDILWQNSLVIARLQNFPKFIFHVWFYLTCKRVIMWIWWYLTIFFFNECISGFIWCYRWPILFVVYQAYTDGLPPILEQ